jgi:C1A family cysteine protease
MQVFTFLSLFSLLTMIDAFNMDSVFCAVNSQSSSNVTQVAPCDMFHGQVLEMCQEYVQEHEPTDVVNCFMGNLRHQSDIESHVHDFIDFIQTHNKVYNTIETFVNRFYIFRENMIFAISENIKNENTYTLGANKMADLLHEEFKDMYITGLQFPRDYCDDKTLSNDLSDSVDWFEKGCVSDVKDQGQCGSCWAFSTVGALEGLQAQESGNLETFSEQYLVSCASSYGNHGCNGGLMQRAFSYVIDNGIPSEESYPYVSGTTTNDETCQMMKPAYQISTCYNVPSNELQLTQYIMQQPTSVSIQASGRSFQLYVSGVYNDPSCGDELDHGVLATGYGTMDGEDYYRVKNSWSDSWGDGGYINIARNSVASSVQGMCGIAMDASVPGN